MVGCELSAKRYRVQVGGGGVIEGRLLCVVPGRELGDDGVLGKAYDTRATTATT